jgi:ribokinase
MLRPDAAAHIMRGDQTGGGRAVTDVVVVGSVNRDLVVQLPRLPAPGETVSDGAFLRAHGGKGANQAATAAALGARTSLVGAVGADDLGAEAREDLRRRGIDLSWLAEVNAPTGVALILVDAEGGNLIAVAPGANLALTSEHVKVALEAVLEGGTVVLGGLEVSNDAVAAAASGPVSMERSSSSTPARRAPSKATSSLGATS